jgi:hypothetical protein
MIAGEVFDHFLDEARMVFLLGHQFRRRGRLATEWAPNIWSKNSALRLASRGLTASNMRSASA